MTPLEVYDSHRDGDHMNWRNCVGCKRFCVAVAEGVVRSLYRTVGLVMVLENGVHIGMMEQETVLEIHIRCVSAAQAKELLNHIHFAWAELEKVHENHSHVFEEQVLIQYYRERS